MSYATASLSLMLQRLGAIKNWVCVEFQGLKLQISKRCWLSKG